MSNGGGGAATNSGIDFQQRIAALVLAHVLIDVKNYSIFQLDDDLHVTEIRFETNNGIDDLVLMATDGRVLIQAKHSLSLSDKLDSEYSSVLKQFVAQYVDDNRSNDMYVLATSSRSSQRITKELRKLTEAARLNEIGSADNPLTKVEEDVMNKTCVLIEIHYLNKTGIAISKETLDCLFRRIRVALLDIEEGAPLELAVLTLLAGKASVSPALLWRSLIALCLSLAKDRLSIDKNGLTQRMGKFIGKASASDVSNMAREFLSLEIQGALSAGREVLLVKSFMEDADYVILELYRFEDDGRRRLKFFDSKVVLLDGSTLDVIHRAATFVGIERFIQDQPNTYSNVRMVIIPINTQENVENEPYAKAHAEYCSHLAESSANPLLCLHCGDPISEDEAPFVEIDDEVEECQVGLVHGCCLRSIDRVLGIIRCDLFREYKHLKNFDYGLWFEKASRGQGLFGAMSHLNNRIFPVAWKPDYNVISKGGWCIKITLDDGSARYAQERGRVVRCAENESIALAQQFNEAYEKAKNKRDPWCFTSESDTYGNYSGVLQVMAEGERCLLCVKAEVVHYTRSIGSAYSKVDNFYAPLTLLLEQDTGIPVTINNAIFLTSNPLQLEQHIENWQLAGIKLPEFVVSIIESDDKFDKFVRQVKDDGGSVIVNPRLTMTGELLGGFIIENYYDLVSNKSGAP